MPPFDRYRGVLALALSLLWAPPASAEGELKFLLPHYDKGVVGEFYRTRDKVDFLFYIQVLSGRPLDDAETRAFDELFAGKTADLGFLRGRAARIAADRQVSFLNLFPDSLGALEDLYKRRLDGLQAKAVAQSHGRFRHLAGRYSTFCDGGGISSRYQSHLDNRILWGEGERLQLYSGGEDLRDGPESGVRVLTVTGAPSPVIVSSRGAYRFTNREGLAYEVRGGPPTPQHIVEFSDGFGTTSDLAKGEVDFFRRCETF